MEEHKLAFFEEPVPFDYYEETKQIAAALKIPIALGEQKPASRASGASLSTVSPATSNQTCSISEA